MIRHFCDLCDAQVKGTSLSHLTLDNLTDSQIRDINRNDVNKAPGGEWDICFNCRRALCDQIEALKVKKIDK